MIDLNHTGLDTDGDEDAEQNQSKEQLLHCTPRVPSRLATGCVNPLAIGCGDRERGEHTRGESEQV